jgi:hypothetical protein
MLLLVASAPAAAASKLPPGTLRGPEDQLQEYPTVSLATPAQRAAAERLRAQIRASARRWRTLRAARAAGFNLHTAHRRPGDRSVHYLHAEHRRFSADRRYLDPKHPEALIYANVPGRPLLFVGVMFSMPRGKKGLRPGPDHPLAHAQGLSSEGARWGAPRRSRRCGGYLTTRRRGFGLRLRP